MKLRNFSCFFEDYRARNKTQMKQLGLQNSPNKKFSNLDQSGEFEFAEGSKELQ